MTEWKNIKREFRDALISGFIWNSLSLVLEYHTDRRLDRITSRSEGFDKNVDDVLFIAIEKLKLKKRSLMNPKKKQK